jgi:predicted esterase
MRNFTRVLYVHGLNSSSKTKKAAHLAEHFNVRCVDMKGSNFDEWVRVQEKEIISFQPDVIVGSSFGGAVVVQLLRNGTWRGPTVLLAQAYVTRDTRDDLYLPDNTPIILIHGERDNTVEVGASRTLCKYGSPNCVKLVEIDDGHELETTIDTGLLVASVREVLSFRKAC